jgi:hypothetical protein
MYVWVSGVQPSLTAGSSYTSDLAKCHKGCLKRNIFGVLKGRGPQDARSWSRSSKWSLLLRFFQPKLYEFRVSAVHVTCFADLILDMIILVKEIDHTRRASNLESKLENRIPKQGKNNASNRKHGSKWSS